MDNGYYEIIVMPGEAIQYRKKVYIPEPIVVTHSKILAQNDSFTRVNLNEFNGPVQIDNYNIIFRKYRPNGEVDYEQYYKHNK